MEIEIVFKKTGAQVKLLVKDGDFVKANSVIAKINGSARSILKGERLALNIIGRMSSIATETKKLIDICKSINPKTTIAATRKTTPGFRKFEKKAVEIGGGEQHRFGLFDAVIIKDNHLKLVGSIEEVINKIKEKIHDKIIEVEVENEKDALTAAELGVDVIMLDNFDPKSGEIITNKIKKINQDIIIEISGGVSPENIANYASFADRISLGYLTHSIKNKDFSLEII
jgi:nicotinate-nucleotide pyrophosphorylase (carboxylating)